MSGRIISSIRKNSQLHGSLLLTAIELAHRADGNNGHVRMSYSLIALKCHCSKRTAMRHINKLISLGIIGCQRFWRPGKRWGINAYRFLIHWEKPTEHPSNSDTMTLTLPKAKIEEREKFGTLEELKRGEELVLSWLTEGSALWKLAKEC